MSSDFSMVVTVVGVKTNAAIPKKSGSGTYEGTLFEYSTASGEQKSRGFPTFQLQKNPDLVTGFSRLKVGEKAYLKFANDANGMSNLTEVRPATAEETAKKSERKSYGGGSYKPKEFDTVGLQVGNALNGAAAVYAAMISSGVTKKFGKKELATIVDTFLEVGTEARAKISTKAEALSRPPASVAQAEPKKEAALATDAEDDDEPFLLED